MADGSLVFQGCSGEVGVNQGVLGGGAVHGVVGHVGVVYLCPRPASVMDGGYEPGQRGCCLEGEGLAIDRAFSRPSRELGCSVLRIISKLARKTHKPRHGTPQLPL